MMMFQPHHDLIINNNDYNCITIVTLKVLSSHVQLLENVICGSPVIGFVDYKKLQRGIIHGYIIISIMYNSF